MRGYLELVVGLGVFFLSVPAFGEAAQSAHCQPASFQYVGTGERAFPKEKVHFVDFRIANKGTKPIRLFVATAWGVTMVYERSVELQEKMEDGWVPQLDLVELRPPGKMIVIPPAMAWSFSFPFGMSTESSWRYRVFRLRVVSTVGCAYVSDTFSP